MTKRLVLEQADRLHYVPPEIDDFLPRRKGTSLLGLDILDLARFSWPIQAEAPAPEKVDDGARSDETARLAEETAVWYRSRFGVRLNPAKEIFIGESIRQTLSLLSLAFFNPGDVVLIPDPGVWHYRAAIAMASAETIPYHLRERTHFKPTLSTMSLNLARLIKGMILNIPHNPTGAVLSREELAELVHWAARANLPLILDQAFCGLVEGSSPVSLFAVPGGKKVGLELYSYAYNFGRPQPAPAFAVGQPTLISELKRIAAVFRGAPGDQQVRSALASLADPDTGLDHLRTRYSRNREALDRLCQRLRLATPEYRSGPFYWARLPGRKQSRRFCRRLYLKCGLLAVPGTAFGEGGEGFIRFSLTADPALYEKALEITGQLFQATRRAKRRNG